MTFINMQKQDLTTPGINKSCVVIEDLYNNPVKINVQELLQLAKSHWQEQMNGWLTEYEENSKER